MTIRRRLIERNLHSYRLLCQLPLTPAHFRARLLWCLSRSALPWPARSSDFSPIEPIWDMMGRRLYLPGNDDDLARELEQIWQEILQKTIRVLYHSMQRLVATCIRTTVGSTPY
ncbi:transposable element Tcb1 transposase [Trichonephila clavipes]|nr:transposable element Tcb1 transposase [Trichonephila clavipes]